MQTKTKRKAASTDRVDRIISETRTLYQVELDRVKGLDDKLMALIGISGVSLTLFLGTFNDMPSLIGNVNRCSVLGYEIGLLLLGLSGLTPLFFLVVRSTLPKPSDVKLLVERDDLDPTPIYATIYAAVWSSTRRSGDWKANGLIAGLVLYVLGLMAVLSVTLIFR